MHFYYIILYESSFPFVFCNKTFKIKVWFVTDSSLADLNSSYDQLLDESKMLATDVYKLINHLTPRNTRSFNINHTLYHIRDDHRAIIPNALTRRTHI